MKKPYQILFFLFFTYNAFAQVQTLNLNFYQIKAQKTEQFYHSLRKFITKYPSNPLLVYSVEGGKHHHQIAILDNIGLTWKQRDSIENTRLYSLIARDFKKNVLPYLTEEQGGEILLYQKNFSSSVFNDWQSKIRINILSIKFSPSEKFLDIFSKNKNAFEKSSISMSIFSNAGLGSSKFFMFRKFPNGWEELDNPNPLKNIFEHLYGKGSYEESSSILREFITENDIIFFTLIPELSKIP